MQYLKSGSGKYRKSLDNNADGFFQEFPVKDFVAELEAKLGRPIDEKYDIQRVPVKSPVGYNYYPTANGYVFWVTCISCGTSRISTLLMDGVTPTVNIVSPGMQGQVTKALTRDKMLADPGFQQWQKAPFNKEGFVRQVEQENLHDSKT